MAKDVIPTQKTVTLTDEQSSMQSLRRNAGTIISAIALALAGYFGWQFYQNHGGRIDTAATNDFAKIQASQQAIADLSQQNTDANKQQLTEKSAALQKDIASFVAAHPDTGYAWQALMMQAKVQTDNNQTAEAVATLKQATTLKINDAGLQAIATLRYAEALLANKQLDDANAALNVSLPAVYDASKNELLGDIALAKNDKAAASDFYQKAWQAIETRNKNQSSHEDRALLRLKMEDLGLSPKMPDEPVSVVTKPIQSETPPVAASTQAATQVPQTNTQKAAEMAVPAIAGAASKHIAEKNNAAKPQTTNPENVKSESVKSERKTTDTKVADSKKAEIKKTETKATDKKSDAAEKTKHSEK